MYYKMKNNSNYIIGEIDIKENDINKETRIINNSPFFSNPFLIDIP